jgi:hypothetical protein
VPRKEIGVMDILFSAGRYLSWGVVSISATNLLVIVLMIGVFVAALLLPFPHGRVRQSSAEDQDAEGGSQP